MILTEAGVVSVGLAEGINEAEIKKRESQNVHQSTVRVLQRARKIHTNLVENNRKLLEHNRRLQETLINLILH